MINFLKHILFSLYKKQNSWEKYRDYIKIHPTAIIDPSASIKIFNPPNPPKICLEIGEGSHIFSSLNLLQPDSSIKIGKNCQIGKSQFISVKSITVGDDVIMAWGITIIDSNNHSLYWEERKNDVRQCRKAYIDTNKEDIARYHNWAFVKTKPVIINDKTWIGFNATILKGVIIGEGAVIGAASVVTKSVKPWTVVAGNPGKLIKKLPRHG